MCGIVGVYNFGNKKEISIELLKKMCDIIIHRGPDEEGYFVNEIHKHIGLGIRRLSIIDLETGSQPIHNEDRSLWVVCNGEIYNFLELRDILAKKGHKFYTKTDIETILHSYEDLNVECLHSFRGMFAFALWDENKQRLFLARDRLGKKPLYYTIHDGRLIFSSEIKAILQCLNFTPEINLEAIHHFLTYQYIPQPITIYKNIFKLPPASFMLCDKNGNIKIEKYWDLDFSRKQALTFEDAKQKIKELLLEATKLRLISDVPLGAFLSGGHDSSIVVGLMSTLSPKPVKTFSIGFPEQGYSELKYARVVAKHFQTEHHEFIVKPNFIELLPKIIWHYDQPFADSSALPTYYVSKVAREHVKVALNGDGGDENFAGYLRYVAFKGSLYFSPPFQIIGKTLTLQLASLIPHIETAKARNIFRYMYRLFYALHERPERRIILWHCFFDNEAKYRIYSDMMREKLCNNDSFNYMANAFLNAPAKDLLDRTFYADITTYLPECLLVKMDIASSANSLETRSPFLDHRLMEFTATLPSSWKLHGFTTKYILKETFKNFLPKEILRRGKQGFGIPVGKWFREDWKDYWSEIVLSDRAIKRGYFRKEALQELLNEHIKGYRDHGYRLWGLLILELWHRVYIDKDYKA
jgi:asparagine synthase (glutamine-hydrolysing)